MVSCVALIKGTGIAESPKDRYYYFGYSMIGMVSLIFATAIIFSIIDAALAVRDIIRNLKKKKNPNGSLVYSEKLNQISH